MSLCDLLENVSRQPTLLSHETVGSAAKRIESKYFWGLLDKLLSSSSILPPPELYIYFINFVIYIDPKIENILASFTYAEAPMPGWTLVYQLFALLD